MSEEKPCARCGAPRPKGRRLYCGDECAQLSAAEKDAALRQSKMSACRRCLGPKELGVRGGKFCASCREVMADASAMTLRERRRRDRIAEINQRLESGEEVLRHPVTFKDGHKWCPRCQEYRPLSAYGSRVPTSKPATYCLPCQKGYNAERRLRIKFGLDYDEYEFLLAAQDYRCAICGGKPRAYMLAVDHDHQTGEIRGLLCSRCNHKLLGAAKDDPARLRRAADYLEEFGPRQVFGERRFVPGYEVSP